MIPLMYATYNREIHRGGSRVVVVRGWVGGEKWGVSA